jgi:hypothetical protein
MLPQHVKVAFQQHLLDVQHLHTQDLEAGGGGVYLPYALERQYPTPITSGCGNRSFLQPTQCLGQGTPFFDPLETGSNGGEAVVAFEPRASRGGRPSSVRALRRPTAMPSSRGGILWLVVKSKSRYPLCRYKEGVYENPDPEVGE